MLPHGAEMPCIKQFHIRKLLPVFKTIRMYIIHKYVTVHLVCYTHCMCIINYDDTKLECHLTGMCISGLSVFRLGLVG